jgi:hypothetical protein
MATEEEGKEWNGRAAPLQTRPFYRMIIGWRSGRNFVMGAALLHLAEGGHDTELPL